MKRVLLPAVVAAVVAAAVAWGVRGLYDGFQLDEGVVHVINADGEQRKIDLVFPSGERRSAVVGAGQAVDFHVANTGEGSVLVMTDGETVDSVGYVTTHNSLSVIVVQSDHALFSQFDRSRIDVP